MRTLLMGLAVTAATASCAGGGSGSHATLTADQAVHQARMDGFTHPSRAATPVSWHCDAHSTQVGPAQPTGRYASYKRPVYTMQFGDRRAPQTKDDTGRIAMVIVVFADARIPGRCAHAGIYTSEHQPLHSGVLSGKTFPSKLIAATTIETHMHKGGAPGTLPATDGQYETYLARGRVFALGLAYDEHDSRIVQADLARIAAEISG